MGNSFILDNYKYSHCFKKNFHFQNCIYKLSLFSSVAMSSTSSIPFECLFSSLDFERESFPLHDFSSGAKNVLRITKKVVICDICCRIKAHIKVAIGHCVAVHAAFAHANHSIANSVLLNMYIT